MKAQLLSLLLIIQVASGNIVLPDITNPILLNPPQNFEKGSVLTTKFSFSAGKLRQGMGFNNVIGLVFPINPVTLLNTDLAFSTIRFSCALSQGTTQISMQAVASDTDEKNIAFCRLIDRSYSHLKNSTVYTLTITLTDVKFSSTKFIRNVALFLASSAKKTRTYFDYINHLGTVGLEDNYTLVSTKPFSITAPSLNKTVGSTNVTPLSPFTLTFSVTVNSVLTKDYIISISFPTAAVNLKGCNPSCAITSTSNGSATNAAKVSGDLKLAYFKEGEYIIQGITEDLVPGRTFKLVISQFEAQSFVTKDGSATDNIQQLTCKVYYPNSFTIISYQQVNIFTIHNAFVNISKINHPEDFSLFAGMAWPIRFEFTMADSLSAGGYVVVQQTNTNNSSLISNFVASTCDFTETSSLLGGSFDKQTRCSPLRKDTNYANQSGDYRGSGIFFHVSNLELNAKYAFTVWIFAEKCGSSNQILNTTATASGKFNYEIAVYDQIDTTKINEDRFASKTRIGLSSATNMLGTCYQGQVRYDYNQQAATVLDYSSQSVTDQSTYELMATEFTQINLLQYTRSVLDSNCDGSGTTCIIDKLDASAAVDGLRRYLYGPNSVIDLTSYVLLQAKVNMHGAANTLKQYLAVNTDSTNRVFPGRVGLQLSKLWFKLGDTKQSGGNNIECLLSWSLKDANDFANAPNKLVSNTVADYAVGATRYWVYQNVADNLTGIDLIKSNLPVQNTDGVYQVLSRYDPTASTFTASTIFNFFHSARNDANDTTTNTFAYFYIFTSCLRWNKPNKITSIYSALDVQLNFYYSSGEEGINTPLRVNRLVKFTPEIGVFYDPATAPVGENNPVVYHGAFGNFSDSSTINPVCVSSINKNLVNNNQDSSVLALFMQNLVLFDTEYNKQDATYPVAPVELHLKVYGMSSANFFTKNTASLRTNGYFFQHYNTNIPIAQTNYYSYLTPSIWVTGNNGTNTTGNSSATHGDLMLPTYCPISDTTSAVQPSVVGFWGKFNNFNDFQGLTKYITDATKKVVNPANFTNATTQFTKNTMKVRFPAYGSSTVNEADQLFFYDTSVATACSAFAVLSAASSGIIRENLSSTGLSFNYLLRWNTPTQPFYYLGKAFSHATLFEDRNLEHTYNYAASHATSYIIGVKRPDLTKVFTNSKFNPIDSIALTCVNLNVANNSYLTNYFNTPVDAFQIDMIAASLDWAGVEIIPENTNYKDDNGATLNAKFTVSTEMPKDAQLNFTTSTGGPNATCGLSTLSTNFSRCTTSNGNTWACLMPAQAKTMVVCCYNVKMADTVSLTSLSFSLPKDTDNQAVQAFVSDQALVDPGSSGTFNWATGNQNLSVFVGDKKALVSNLIFAQTSNQGGLGVMQINVTLNREVLFNSKFTITSNFTRFSSDKLTQKCFVHFDKDMADQDWDKGDKVVDECAAAGWTADGGTITVKFRKNLTLCKKSVNGTPAPAMANTFWISVYPVLISSVAADLNYKADYVLEGNNEAVATNSVDQTFPLVTNLGAASTNTFLEGLCNVKEVFPLIVAEYATWTFTFNFGSQSAGFGDNQPNEISIFFPLTVFGNLNELDLICVYNNTNYPCAVTAENILNFFFDIQGTDANNTAVDIKISGLRNPELAADVELVMPCSINRLITTNERISLGIGNGVFNNGITFKASEENTVPLIFYNQTYSALPSTPRSVGAVTFQVGFDKISPGYTIPTEITNNPYFLIKLPKEYPLQFYKDKVPTVLIREYSLNSLFNPIISSTINDGNNTTKRVEGNSIFFGVGNRRDVPAGILYWEFVISNLVLPEDNTDTTSQFEVTLTNEDNSFIFTTYTNMNTHYKDILTTDRTLKISHFRGIPYKFDNKKFVVDVVEAPQDTDPLNQITVIPGVYVKYFFKVRENKFTISPAKTNISLGSVSGNANAKLRFSSYLFASAEEWLEFEIGVPCGEVPGRRLLYFTHDNPDVFAPLAVVTLIIDDTQKAVLNCPEVVSIPNEGFFFGQCDLSHTAFEPFTVTFENETANASTITPVEYLEGDVYKSLTVTSKNVSGNLTEFQSLDVKVSKTCFQPNKDTFAFNITGDFVNLTNYRIGELMTFQNSDSDGSLLTERNSLRFTFETNVFPVMSYCAVLCYERKEFPSDASILAQNKLTETPLLKYFTVYLEDERPRDIIVKGLVRNQRYKVKCISQSNQVDRVNRSEAQEVIETLTTPGSTTPTEITVSKSTPTQCARFVFLTKPLDATLDKFLYYCQYLYSFENEVLDGCTYCVDLLGKKPDGIEFNRAAACTTEALQSSASGGRRMLQTSTTHNYTVCAIQDKNCPNDLTGSKSFESIFTDYVSALNSDTNIETAINESNVPISDVVRTSDSSNPSVDDYSVGSSTYSQAGNFAIAVTGKAKELRCYYLIAENSVVPVKADIEFCTDLSWCGQIDIPLQTTVEIKANPNSVRSFASGITYNAHFLCYNQVVNPLLSSEIKIVYTFTVPKEAGAGDCPETTITRSPDGVCYCPVAEGAEAVINKEAGDCPTVSSYWVTVSLLLLSLFLI